ncbi:Uncharacterized conserved protein YbjT, contains NAD(P)-binding and DUF2867 domains [Nonomuraea solani]|uniref:Uncharacterized conserved protein YbjT, contains NAD(P)-binding and DUF2867 domains n=1 Tax=Nonomuraea solani TaxID=1144553 RepID=A0A1H6ERQ9_9ACTN|nr:NmrA family NAD(P)-binding protein [Nonomuraea solani]SEH00540.1 Uncharacterized conserved protein YbjT, contains NAD(P)-binding and DUF2867 domains [Nonomuraea solani]
MILVTGATGNVGGEVVEALRQAGRPVRALVRKPVALEGVSQVTGDLNDPASLEEALDGVSSVFLLPGYRDMPGMLARCRSAGVTSVVLLTSPATTATDTSNAISQYMIASETAVRESGLAWTFVRPCAFMSNALRWLPQLAQGDVVRDAWGGVRTATVDPADIAAVARAALVSPSDHDGRVYQLSGPEPLLPADRVAILGRVLGRDLTFEGQSDDEARAQMSAAMPAEYVAAFFSFYSDGTLDESRVLPTVEEVTGRPPRTFEQWATAHAAAFR